MKNTLSPNKISWDIWLFSALYVIAPSYCAIELSSRLPLITLSRALLVLLGVMLILRRGGGLLRDMGNLNLGLSVEPCLRRGLIMFFVLLTVCHVVLFPSNASGALKAIFVLLMEGYALVWLLTQVLDTREKIEASLKILVVASGITALIVMVGCAFSFHPFHILNLVRREMPMTFEYRLGLVRAEAGFGHPCYYGAFCAIIAPVNMYFIEHSRKKWKRKLFAVCLALNMTGVVLSNARGSFLTVGFVVLVAVIRSFLHKEFGKFLRTYIPVGLMAIIFLVIVSALSSVGLAFLLGFIKSILSIVFPDISMNIALDPAVTESIAETVAVTESIAETVVAETIGSSAAETVASADVVGYGLNENGLSSRLIQFSGIEWTLTQKPLFGFGHNAHVAGLISYEFVENVWLTTLSFDVGIVAIIGQYGLVGLLGYLALFGSALKESLSKTCFRDPLMRYLSFALVTYLVHLLTIASLEKLLWVLIAMIVCLSNVLRRQSL